jgi:hypothetical protein
VTGAPWAGWRDWHVNRLVPWYLMASYAYYMLDRSIMPDEEFDGLCKRLLEEFDFIEHPHKHLIDESSLEAGTGYGLREEEYPGMCKGAVEHILTARTED